MDTAHGRNPRGRGVVTGHGTGCADPNHAHYDEESAPMLCNDCGAPTHYDYGLEQYRHDDPATPACFLIGGTP